MLVVGVARLTASLLGVPNSKAGFLSLTFLGLLGMVYYSGRVYTSGFGSYKQLLPVLALQVILCNIIVIGGIVIAILTDKNNIFSAPEFSPGKVDGKTWGHVAIHFIAIISMSLVFWAVGSLIMLVTKKLGGATGLERPSAAAVLAGIITCICTIIFGALHGVQLSPDSPHNLSLVGYVLLLGSAAYLLVGRLVARDRRKSAEEAEVKARNKF